MRIRIFKNADGTVTVRLSRTRRGEVRVPVLKNVTEEALRSRLSQAVQEVRAQVPLPGTGSLQEGT